MVITTLAVSLGPQSLVQLGVALSDVALLIAWGKKFGNFLRAADNDVDLVKALDEELGFLLPRTSLIVKGHMEARWSSINFAYQGQIVNSKGKHVKDKQDLTEFGWFMVAVIAGLDLCLSNDRMLDLAVDVIPAVLERQGEAEENLRVVLPTNIESWRQVGRVRGINVELEKKYMVARQKQEEGLVVPQLNKAEESEMQRFLIWLMRDKHDNHFSALSVDLYAFAAGLRSVGIKLRTEGKQAYETEPVVSYCSSSRAPDLLQPFSDNFRAKGMQVSYPLRRPESMIQIIKTARHILNEMDFLWALGSEAAELFHLKAESRTTSTGESEIYYSVEGEDFSTESAHGQWTMLLADRGFPTLARNDAGSVLRAVERLTTRTDKKVTGWLYQHTELEYLKKTDMITGEPGEMEAMLKYQALIFGFYFKLLDQLVCFDLVNKDMFCHGLWGFGSTIFLAMCIEFGNTLRKDNIRSHGHSGVDFGGITATSSNDRPTKRNWKVHDRQSPFIDLAAADSDGELYAGSGSGISNVNHERRKEDFTGRESNVAPKKPTESWSIHAKMGASVKGGLSGVVMAAKCSGRLVGWFNPLAADVTFLSTAYLPLDEERAPNDYDVAHIPGFEITDKEWQSGYLPRQVGVNEPCFRMFQSWGCPALRYAATGFFATLDEEVAISTGNIMEAFGRIEGQGSGVIIT